VTTNASGELVVSWVAPDAQGDVITEYQVQFYVQGEYHMDTDYCDGSVPDVFFGRKCTIPMLHLTETYGNLLSPGDSIEFRMRARNNFGWSAWSDISTTGTLIQAIPPAPPASFSIVYSDSQELVIDWDSVAEGAASGYSEV
jgi:hypothetical protein